MEMVVEIGLVVLGAGIAFAGVAIGRWAAKPTAKTSVPKA